MRKVKPLSEYQKGIYGEILGEFFNPIFFTYYTQLIDYQPIECFEKSRSAKTQPREISMELMTAPELHCTIPRLYKGKKIESVPKCSTRAKEKALQNWYVDFLQ
jgi:hypothetical protein